MGIGYKPRPSVGVMNELKQAKRRQDMKSKALARKRRNTIKRCSPAQIEFMDKVTNELIPPDEAVRDVYYGPNGKPENFELLKASCVQGRMIPSTIIEEFQVRQIPMLALLAKSQQHLWTFLSKDHLCPKCVKKFEHEFDPKVILASIDKVLNALKDTGAMTLWQRAMEETKEQSKDIREIAADFLRANGKAIVTDETPPT